MFSSILRSRRLPVATVEMPPRVLAKLHDIEASLYADNTNQNGSKIFRNLNAIPRCMRNDRWICAYLLALAKYNRKANRLNALSKKFRKKLINQGDSAVWDEFEHKFEEAFKPAGLPWKVFTPLSGDDNIRLASALGALCDEFASRGLCAFPNSGTLLGLVRKGEFILSDDDIDLALIIPCDGENQMLTSFLKVYAEIKTIPTLNLAGGPFHKSSPVFAGTLDGFDVPIDIFPCWDVQGRIIIWPHAYGDYSADDMMPFTEKPLHGVNLKIPRNYRQVLKHNYGPNWSTPDPGFEFDWKAAKKRFRRFLLEYRFRRFLWKVGITGG